MTQAQMYLHRLLQILSMGGRVREEVLVAAEQAVKSETASVNS